MAEDEGDESVSGLTAVPPWVLRVVRDVAETKATMHVVSDQVTSISGRLDTFVTRDEYKARHNELVVEIETLKTQRVEILWDEHNAQRGAKQTHERNERWWRYGMATVIALLTLWALLRQGHVL